MSKVKRIFVEKKKGFQVEASKLFKDIKESLGIDEIEGLRIINRYDVSGIGEEEYEKSKHTIFSERTVDRVFEETVELNKEHKVFAVEFLPGQYDQRADSAAQCIQIFTGKERPKVAFA